MNWIAEDRIIVELLRTHLASPADCQEIYTGLTSKNSVIFAPWGSQGIELTSQCLDSASRLKVIAGTFDNRFDRWLDLADAKQRGITVVDTSRSVTPTVAEFALAMMLNLLRDIPHVATDICR